MNWYTQVTKWGTEVQWVQWYMTVSILDWYCQVHMPFSYESLTVLGAHQSLILEQGKGNYSPYYSCIFWSFCQRWQIFGSNFYQHYWRNHQKYPQWLHLLLFWLHLLEAMICHSCIFRIIQNWTRVLPQICSWIFSVIQNVHVKYFFCPF